MALKDGGEAKWTVYLVISIMGRKNQKLRLLSNEGKKFWVVPPDRQKCWTRWGESRITGGGHKWYISYLGFWPTTAAGTMVYPTISSIASLSFLKLWPTALKIHWQNREDSVWDATVNTFYCKHPWLHESFPWSLFNLLANLEMLGS